MSSSAGTQKQKSQKESNSHKGNNDFNAKKAGKRVDNNISEKEIGGPKGLEPTRYGDWEFNGRCTDF